MILTSNNVDLTKFAKERITHHLTSQSYELYLSQRVKKVLTIQEKREHLKKLKLYDEPFKEIILRWDNTRL